jgi:ubiquinone/menaquinone biosynthesis C-methylase UbiE
MYNENNIMKKFSFDKSYNNYFKNRVVTALDGTKIASDEVIGALIDDLGISNSDKVLDLGCGYGRLFPLLKNYSDKIYGVDIDMSMINDATVFDYYSLHATPAEDTRFPKDYFDKIIVFGVFDALEQEQCLVELNRILKNGGKCLITGKNIDYYPDDEKALIAEKNAARKNFPNHFTDVKKLLNNIGEFGFSCNKLVAFKRRGDFGNNNKVLITNIKKDYIFYEYCMMLEKGMTIERKIKLHFAKKQSNTLKKIYKI